MGSVVAPDGKTLTYRISRPATDTPRGTLVLIHGLASNATRWSEFVGTTQLSQNWNLLRVDLRGHGGSLDHGRISMDVWCKDLAAVLAEERISRAVIVGHCLGANVALWFADRAPQAVEALVLIEPMFRDALRGTLARVAKLRRLLVPAVFVLGLLGALGLHQRRLKPLDLEVLDRETRAAMHGTEEFPVERYTSVREDLKSFPLSVYLQDLLAVTAATPELSVLRMPALALLSSGGVLSDPGLTEKLLARMPDCRIESLASQHWIPTDQPKAMRRAIEDFCERLG